MIRKKISTFGNSAAVVLSRDLLDLMDVKVGDEIDLTLVGRSLIVRPVFETTRKEKVIHAIDRVLNEDAPLLERLAN